MRKVFALLVLGITFGLFACENEDEAEDQSSALGKSHNTGKDCMSCHRFTVSGSVYNKALSSGFPGAVIKLTSQADGAGTVLGTFTTNKSSSFYTSSKINFGSGIFVSVIGSSGKVKHMSSAITSGACNYCHGSFTSKVWTE